MLKLSSFVRASVPLEFSTGAEEKSHTVQAPAQHFLCCSLCPATWEETLELSLEQSVTEPAGYGQAVTHGFCHSRRGPGRRKMRSPSPVFFQALAELVTLVTH